MPDSVADLAEKESHLPRQVIGFHTKSGVHREIFHILIADDHQENRDVLKAMLAPLGFEIAEAENGQEAFERCTTFRAGSDFSRFGDADHEWI